MVARIRDRHRNLDQGQGQDCDQVLLRQAVRGSLSADAHERLAKHIEHCHRCRSRLDEFAGSEDWTAQVSLFLGPDRDGDDDGDEDEARRGGLGIGEAEGSIRDWTSLSFLGPSDDPTKLGRLGPYEVESVVGRGGMGLVLKAHEPELNRWVAIKVLASELAARSAARRRFAREAKAAASVVHDHVIPIYAVNISGAYPYLVMPFVAGCSLQDRLDAEGSLGVAEVLRIAKQCALGLAAAHAQGLVHRDVKPANILLENGFERVRLSDFGLARAVDDVSQTQIGAIVGTPQYMSPEQARGEGVDHRADLFSLGSVMYAMCAGWSPFRADSTLAVLRRITDSKPRDLREINPDVPEWLCRIIATLHCKEPAGRYQSAAELADLLERSLAHVQRPTLHPLPKELGALPIAKPRAWRGAAIAVAVIAVAVIAPALTIAVGSFFPPRTTVSSTPSPPAPTPLPSSSSLEIADEAEIARDLLDAAEDAERMESSGFAIAKDDPWGESPADAALQTLGLGVSVLERSLRDHASLFPDPFPLPDPIPDPIPIPDSLPHPLPHGANP